MATPSGDHNDGDDGNINASPSWSAVTNWTIAGGSLDTSITFDSSDSPIDDSEAVVDAEGKPRLVLKPPAHDCGPCEVKISFTQKHEVRQVYVRSTARVYEIYLAPSLRSSNEYLCTVRCGIASRDDEVLHDAEEPAGAHAGAHSEGPPRELAKQKCSDDGNISPNLDDWIEVKVPDSPSQDKQRNLMPEKVDANPGVSIQDFYEATAEITDADGCISLTIRLLSLQSKGCLYVDEIYVFADPVESADAETQVSQVATSTGNSLMAMLVPTLLQLSRTGNNRRHDKQVSDTLEKGEYLEAESGINDSTNISNEIKQEEAICDQRDVKLQEVNEAIPEPPQFQILAKISDREQTPYDGAKPDMPYDHREGALEQLVSRVSRIEDILLRFEENMLKPISSIDARLQRVEQQVEMLTKNSQYTGLPSGTRISAPSFSCNGSTSSSFYNGADDYPACGAIELEKKDTAADKLSNPPDDMSVSVNETRYLPGLVVTAPEFSSGDDEESNDDMGLQEDCPQEKTKQALSIDDALAAALAGFLSASSVHPSHYTPTLTVQAPEFPIEGNGDDAKVVSPSAQCDKPVFPTIFSGESNGKECINESVSTSSRPSSILVIEQAMGNFDCDFFKEISEKAGGLGKMDEGGASCSPMGTSVKYPMTEAEFQFGQVDDCQIVESTSVSERTEILKHGVGKQTDDTSGALSEGAAASDDDVVDGSENDTLRDVYNSSSAACVVDFDLPILDVKFGSCETSSATLDALLNGMPEFVVESPAIQQREDDLSGDQSNLILVKDGEPNCSLSGHHLFVDCDSYDATDAPSGIEGEAPQYSYAIDEQETSVSLI